MKTYEFTLILSGVSELTPELANSLYEATGGDIELNMCNGITYMECTRKAKSLRDAILEVIAEVEGSNVGVRVLRVESEAANTIAKINADLLSTSNQ